MDIIDPRANRHLEIAEGTHKSKETNSRNVHPVQLMLGVLSGSES